MFKFAFAIQSELWKECFENHARVTLKLEPNDYHDRLQGNPDQILFTVRDDLEKELIWVKLGVVIVNVMWFSSISFWTKTDEQNVVKDGNNNRVQEEYKSEPKYEGLLLQWL